MNLFKIFWLENKTYIIGLLTSYIVLILGYIFIACLNYITQMHILSDYLYRAGTILSPILFLLIWLVPGIIFVLNLTGRKKRMVTKYYGKKTFLKYSLFLNLLFFLTVIILSGVVLSLNNINENITNVISQNQFIEYNGTTNHEIIKMPSFLMLLDFQNVASILIYSIMFFYLIITGIIYSCFFTFRNLYFNSKYKYNTKKVKIFVIIKKIFTYAILGFFVFIIFTINEFDFFEWHNGFVQLFNVNVAYSSQYINSVLIAFSIYTIIIIDYIKIYNDETFV